MQYKIEAVTRVTAEYTPGDEQSKHVATEFYLNLSPNLDARAYVNEEILTKRGSEALTQTLVQGLVGSIHFAHERGYRDSAEHLRYIISELERGFVAVANVQKGRYER